MIGAGLDGLAAHRELVQALGPAAERQGLSDEQPLEELKQDRQSVYTKIYGAVQA